MIHYVNEEAIYHTEEYDVILLPMNIAYDFSDGFAMKLRNRYPEIEKADNTTGFYDLRKLGKRLNVGKVSIMYIFRSTTNGLAQFLDYEALENVMKTANNEFFGKKVMTTMMFGTKIVENRNAEKIKNILENNNDKIDLYVYEPMGKRQKLEKDDIKAMFKGKKDKEGIEQELKKRFLILNEERQEQD